MENNNLDWINWIGTYSSKGCELKFQKDLYDMVGIINITIPTGDEKNKNSRFFRSSVQEDYIYKYVDEKLFSNINDNGKRFLDAIKLIGADEAEYKKVRPRDKNFIMHNNILKDEKDYWKNFFDELNIEYRIEEKAFCWWSGEILPNYNRVWVNEEQFKLIENSKKYISALKNLHESIENHYKAKKNGYELLEEKKKRQEAFESGMKKIDSLVGLTEVKDMLKEIIARAYAKQRAKQLGIKVGKDSSNHLMFIGNPGTGKTIVARALCEIYYGLGILKTNTFIEINKNDLIIEYVGHTEKNVEKIFKKVIEAGGMLFVDEFHQLYDGKNSKGLGNIAIESMVPYIENYRDKFVLVLAGYPEKMAKAINYDPGFEQRCSEKINFRDYSKTEVFEIFKNLCTKNNKNIDKNRVLEVFTTLPDGGNGRIARDIYEHSLSKKALRIFEMGNISDKQFEKEYNNITLEDINNSINTIISKYNKNDKEETKTIELM